MRLNAYPSARPRKYRGSLACVRARRDALAASAAPIAEIAIDYPATTPSLGTLSTDKDREPTGIARIVSRAGRPMVADHCIRPELSRCKRTASSCEPAQSRGPLPSWLWTHSFYSAFSETGGPATTQAIELALDGARLRPCSIMCTKTLRRESKARRLVA